MKLEKTKLYLLQDVSGKKAPSASFGSMQLFRPFAKAAAKNKFRAIFAGVAFQLYPTPMPVVEFMVASDVPEHVVAKTLASASRALKRTLAIRPS